MLTFYPFLETPKSEHRFKSGASFEKVMLLYRFDRKLRLLLLRCAKVSSTMCVS